MINRKYVCRAVQFHNIRFCTNCLQSGTVFVSCLRSTTVKENIRQFYDLDRQPWRIRLEKKLRWPTRTCTVLKGPTKACIRLLIVGSAKSPPLHRNDRRICSKHSHEHRSRLVVKFVNHDMPVGFTGSVDDGREPWLIDGVWKSLSFKA